MPPIQEGVFVDFSVEMIHAWSRNRVGWPMAIPGPVRLSIPFPKPVGPNGALAAGPSLRTAPRGEEGFDRSDRPDLEGLLACWENIIERTFALTSRINVDGQLPSMLHHGHEI